jgi:tetratricopeptide (TPR) repeat protein
MRNPRLWILIVLAVAVLGVWSVTSPTARAYRLARLSTDELRRRAEAAPGDLLLQESAAERLLRDGRAADAVAILERSVTAGNGAPDLLALLGTALAAAGRDDDAFSYLRLAGAQQPRADALREIGALYLKHQRPDKALPELEQAVQLDASDPRGWQLLALARRRESNWAEAAAALRKAVALRPDAAELSLALGECLIELGQLGAAETELRRSMTRIAADQTAPLARAHALLGRLMLSRTPFERHAEKAEAELREAMQLDPTLNSARFALGHLFARTGRWSDAESEFREALRRDPSLLQARFQLARALRSLGRGAEADAEMTRYHRDYTLDHEEMQLRGRLTLRPGDPALQARLDRLLKEKRPRAR